MVYYVLCELLNLGFYLNVFSCNETVGKEKSERDSYYDGFHRDQTLRPPVL